MTVAPIATPKSGRTVAETLPNIEIAGLPQISAQWARVRARLQSEVGEVEYRTWLRQMTLGAIDGDEITVHLPTRFLRDWVRGHYGDRLNALWQAENQNIRRVDIRVGSGVMASGLAESLAALPPAGEPWPPALPATG